MFVTRKKGVPTVKVAVVCAAVMAVGLSLSACNPIVMPTSRVNSPSDIVCRKLDLQRDFLDRGMIPVQAHRGGGFALPENTLETFRATWGAGMIPEADIRTTRDGVIVCIHDDHTKRLAPDIPSPWNALKIGEMTLEQVKRLDVGSFRNKPGQRVPTLQEVFQEMQKEKRRMIFLDYKYVDMGRLARMVQESRLENQVIFTSQHYDLIREWCRYIPRATTMLWMGGDEQQIQEKFEGLRESDFAGISILQIHVRYDEKEDRYRPSLEFLNARRRELEKRQILPQVLPWGISDPSVFDRLMAEGFRSFATDYCQTALEVYTAGLTQYGVIREERYRAP
jgi:glycerophosphoryl diester phosphodiesterase